MARTARMLALLVLCGLLIWAVPLVLARQATITTKSGNSFTGELVSEDANQVVLDIAGIRTPFPRSDIEKLEKKLTPEEEYAQRRAALADDDFDGRYQLAYDMFEGKHYQISLKELNALKKDFPDENRVDRMIELVNMRIKLEQQQQEQQQLEQRQTAHLVPRTTAAGEHLPQPHPTQNPLYLTEQQINTIRLWELPADLEAARPRVVVPEEVLDELFSRYQSNNDVPKGANAQRIFRGRPGWEQLELIFQLQARDLYDKVQVREDPAPLREFRRTINPAYVARYFRNNFGSGQVPGLTLLASNIGSVAEAYTNFYILSTAEHDGHKFIDRDRPAESLLLQWGLPRDQAKYPAPDEPNWRPFFRSSEDPVYEHYLNWIGTLYKSPDYNITYPPPAATDDGKPSAPAAAESSPATAKPAP